MTLESKSALSWLALFTAALALASPAAPARAQGMIPTVIGVTVGNMAAQDRERACMAGTPVAAGVFTRVEGLARSLMADYQARAAAHDAKGLRKLFVSGRRAVWHSVDGAGDVAAIQDPFFSSSGAVLTFNTIQVAGDGGSAYAVWSLTPAGAASPSAQYAVTLVGGFGGWKILRMRLYAAPAAAPEGKAYCHLAQVGEWAPDLVP